MRPMRLAAFIAVFSAFTVWPFPTAQAHEVEECDPLTGEVCVQDESLGTAASCSAGTSVDKYNVSSFYGFSTTEASAFHACTHRCPSPTTDETYTFDIAIQVGAVGVGFEWIETRKGPVSTCVQRICVVGAACVDEGRECPPETLKRQCGNYHSVLLH